MSETQPQVRHQTVMDDEARHVARVYAEALYRAAEKAGNVEEVLDELESLVDGVFGQNPGLELLFASAAVGYKRKNEIITHTFEGRASQVFTQFMRVLNDHARLDMIRPIAGAFRTLYNRRSRRLAVRVRSAVPLTEAERSQLTEDVRAASGMEPILNEAVDPEILGGLIVQVQDWVYDASVRTRLAEIRNQLIERSSHDIQSGRDRFSTHA